MFVARSHAQKSVKQALHHKEEDEKKKKGGKDDEEDDGFEQVEEHGHDPEEGEEQQQAAVLCCSKCEFEIKDPDWATNPEQYSKGSLKRCYLIFTEWVRKNIAQAEWFNSFILLCICIAGVMVGIQNYEAYDASADSNNPKWGEATEASKGMATVDVIVSRIFESEVLFKIIAGGLAPLRYFYNKDKAWNWLDFGIAIGGRLNLGNVKLLRLVRLARLSKLLRRIPNLQMIIMGLIGGMKSIGYILLLMFLIFYLFAIMGMQFFGDQDSFHFGSIQVALVTLFRCATLEDWTDVMYTAFYGCEYFDSQFVSEENWAQLYGRKTVRSNELQLFRCLTNKKQTTGNKFFVIFYFVLFIVVASFVMLSLFIAAVTMSMGETVDAQKEIEAEEAAKAKEERRKKREERKLQSIKSMQSMTESDGSAPGSPVNIQRPISPDGRKMSVLDHIKEMPRKATIVKEVLQAKVMDMYEGMAEMDKDSEESKLNEVLSECYYNISGTSSRKKPDPNPYPPGWQRSYFAIALKFRAVAESSYFKDFITIVICIAAVLVGCSTYNYCEGMEPSESVHLYRVGSYTDKSVCVSMYYINQLILYIFTAEVIIKYIAEGFSPWCYHYSGWNNFDCIIVILSYALSSQRAMMPLLRILRLFRVLKLLKAFPELAVIINAFISAFASIGYIGLLLVLTFYIFAIIGMMLFQTNDPWHFGTMHISLVTLFRCATFEDWTDVMYINMYGCDNWGYDDWPYLCQAPSPQPLLSVIFFIAFTVLAGFIEITLFIGVITTAMDEAQNDVKNAAKVEARVKALGEENNLPKVAIDKYREAFEIFDPEGDGALSEEAIGKVVEAVNQTIPPDEFEIMWFESMADDSTDFDFACFLQFMLALQLRDKGVTPHKLRGLMSQNSPTSPGPFSLGASSDSGTNLPILSSTNKLKEAAKYAVAEGKEPRPESKEGEGAGLGQGAAAPSGEVEAKSEAKIWSEPKITPA